MRGWSTSCWLRAARRRRWRHSGRWGHWGLTS
ncbi:hypothetical protein HaLaN_13701, partial [Haematococcus lacustris]